MSEELLRQLSHDELTPAELKGVEDHVSHCQSCQHLWEFAQSDPPWQEEIVPILRSPRGAQHVGGEHDKRNSEEESLESIMRLLGPSNI